MRFESTYALSLTKNKLSSSSLMSESYDFLLAVNLFFEFLSLNAILIKIAFKLKIKMYTQNNKQNIPLAQRSIDGPKPFPMKSFSGKLPISSKKDSPKEMVVEKNTPDKTNRLERNKILLSWKAFSFLSSQKSNIWYVVVFVILVSLVALGLFSDNFPLAILAILIGLILYLFEKKEAQSFNFSVTTEGIVAQDRLYKFSSLENFWIFYEPGGKKDLSLKSAKNFIPYIHIPLGDVDPTLLRKILLEFIPEVEHEEAVVDSLEMLF